VLASTMEGDQETVTLLYSDSTMEEGLPVSWLQGNATAPQSGFQTKKKPRVAPIDSATGRPKVGIRTGSLEQQRCQVMIVVDKATSNLKELMTPRAGCVVSLEHVFDRATGSPPRRQKRVEPTGMAVLTAYGESATIPSRRSSLGDEEEVGMDETLLRRLAKAGEACSIVEQPSVDPAPQWIKDVMFEAGKKAGSLSRENRAFAETLLGLALEYLLASGALNTSTMFDNFAPHASARLKMGTPGSEEGVDHIISPIIAIMTVLAAHPSCGGVLSCEEIAMAKDEATTVYTLSDGKQRHLHALWRLFDVKHDGLRRCVDHYERSRPMPACLTRKSKKIETAVNQTNPCWQLA